MLWAPIALAFACATAGVSTTKLRFDVDPTDADGEVYLDGNYVGQMKELTDETSGPPLLAPGVHRVEVRKPGRFPVQKTVRVDRSPPPETTVSVELLEDPR